MVHYSACTQSSRRGKKTPLSHPPTTAANTRKRRSEGERQRERERERLSLSPATRARLSARFEARFDHSVDRQTTSATYNSTCSRSQLLGLHELCIPSSAISPFAIFSRWRRRQRGQRQRTARQAQRRACRPLRLSLPPSFPLSPTPTLFPSFLRWVECVGAGRQALSKWEGRGQEALAPLSEKEMDSVLELVSRSDSRPLPSFPVGSCTAVMLRLGRAHCLDASRATAAQRLWPAHAGQRRRTQCASLPRLRCALSPQRPAVPFFAADDPPAGGLGQQRRREYPRHTPLLLVV